MFAIVVKTISRVSDRQKQPVQGCLSFSKCAVLLLIILYSGIIGCRNPPKQVLAPLRPVEEAPLLRAGVRLNAEVSVAGVVQTRAEDVRVSVDGDISLPLIGTEHVRDLSFKEAEIMLAQRYSEYYVNPVVRLDFIFKEGNTTSPWGYITVLGRVRNPGRVGLPSTGDMTVTHAIQRAGGLAPGARIHSIRVTRLETDGRNNTFRVNLRKVGTGSKRHTDKRLQENDFVYIPEAFF